ncbi:MAG: hypothetical protein HY329_13455 [Chloroflexi bacterium]|nr:hypothetical protein [Chloroflexota bacterium]
MGRYYWDKKDTVEDCKVLDVGRLSRDRWLIPGNSGTTRWKRGEVDSGSIGWIAERQALRLIYTVSGWGREKHDVDYRVTIVSEPMRFGGERRWFVCPGVRNGRACHRRVAKIYLPPSGTYFLCRHCHDLSYESRQRHIPPYWRLMDRLWQLERTLEQEPVGRSKWQKAALETDAVLAQMNMCDPLEKLRARAARLEEQRSRPKRGPGRPSKRCQREWAKLLRDKEKAAQAAEPKRPRGRPKLKRAYTRRQPLVLTERRSDRDAYCVRCRDRRELTRPRQVILRNGRTAIRGRCSTCGTRVARITGKCAD